MTGKNSLLDSGLELSRVQTPSVAFVAFYSDIEREVTIVESGYRVSLTYNLYVSDATQQVIPSLPSSSATHNELKLKQALSDLLDEDTFLPEGGTIGFGLLHKYPVSKTKESLQSVLNCLKGSDAAVRRVCAALGLELKPKVIYRETDGEVLILLDEFLELGHVDTSFPFLMCKESHHRGEHDNEGEYYDEDSNGGWYYPKGFIVESRGLQENGGGEYEFDRSWNPETQFRYQEIWWLTKRTELTRERTDFVVDFEVVHTYGDVVLLATVGGHVNRRTSIHRIM